MNDQNFNNFNNDPQNNQGFDPNFATEPDPKAVEGEKKASTSKTLGIIGIVVGLMCCSLAGVVLDIISLTMANTSRALLGYEHNDAKVGKTCAIIGLVIAGIGFIVNIASLIALPIIEANFNF